MSDKAALGRRGGAAGDRTFRLVCLAAALAVLAILALILVSTTNQALPALRTQGWRFVTSPTWIPNDPDGDGPRTAQFGALAFIYGTCVASLLALILAVPVSIGIALFLTEVAPRRLRRVVVTMIDLLAAIPSVVFGLWGILVVAPALVPLYQWLHRTLGAIPPVGHVLGPPVSNGYSFATAGLILAIMIIPIITSVTREVFSTVPTLDKQAAFALGATRWEMIKCAVLPHSFGGMVGAVVLGLGRAMGETIAIALVIGAATQITPNIFASGEALPSIIVHQWGESSGLHTSALVGLGVVLFALTVMVNSLARIVVRRTQARMGGARA